ncbi:hypothetical protein [Fusobacterium sp.]|uniref:hypothetical protein n=1 Tax=Fusobacterium sp. TaxID=68766 RepID=UPI002A805C3D|nr:hypothetical protein [Fusobacterium sp.]
MNKILMFVLLSTILFAARPTYKEVGDIPKGTSPTIELVASRHRRTHSGIALVVKIDNYYALIYATPKEMTDVINNRYKKPIEFDNNDEFSKWMTKEELLEFLKNKEFKYRNYKEYLK